MRAYPNFYKYSKTEDGKVRCECPGYETTVGNTESAARSKMLRQIKRAKFNQQTLKDERERAGAQE